MNNISFSENFTFQSFSLEQGLVTEIPVVTSAKPTLLDLTEEEQESLSAKKIVYNIPKLFLSENTKERRNRMDENIPRANEDMELMERRRNGRVYSHKSFKMKEVTLGNEININKNNNNRRCIVNQGESINAHKITTSFFNTKENVRGGDMNEKRRGKRGLRVSTINGRRDSVLKTRIPFLHRHSHSQLDQQSFTKIVSQAEQSTQYGCALKRIRIVDILLGIFVTVNIILTLLDNELAYSKTDQYVTNRIAENGLPEGLDMYLYMKERLISPVENTIRGINLVLVICLLVLVYLHYYFSAKILHSQGLLLKYEGIYCAGMIKPLVGEMVILCLVYPPYCNVFIYGKMLGMDYCYTLNSIICIFVTFKSYIIPRVYTYFSKWTNDTAKSICNEANVNPGVHFAFKAELKNRPYTMLALIFTCVILILAFALRTFEYYVITKDKNFSSSKDEESENINEIISISNFRSLITSIWLILVTMTTVGYGDYVPKSHYGRFICISCIIGLLLVSLVVVSLAMITDFSEEEKKAYSLLKKITADQNVIDKAHEVIKCFLRFRKIVVNKGAHKLLREFILITQLRNAISAFKNDSKLAKSMSLPLDKTFKIINNNFLSDYKLLNANISRISNLDENFMKLSSSQRECWEILQIVQERELRLGEYLIQLNNALFKRAILKYKEKSKSQVTSYPLASMSTKLFSFFLDENKEVTNIERHDKSSMDDSDGTIGKKLFWI